MRYIFILLLALVIQAQAATYTGQVVSTIDHRHYQNKQQEFLDFVLEHYVAEGVGELAQEKLPDLLALKYMPVGDAVAQIRDVFIGFQKHLYGSQR